jgi:hypothetical protein
MDGDRKAEQVLELAPSATQTVTFPLSLAAPGRYHGRVSKNRDRLGVDDDRFFLLEVSNSIPVVVVSGRRAATAAGAGVPATFYVEKALNPRGTAEGEFAVKVIDQRDITAAALSPGVVVVWVDPQRVEPRRLALIERRVRRGADCGVPGEYAARAGRGRWISRAHRPSWRRREERGDPRRVHLLRKGAPRVQPLYP